MREPLVSVLLPVFNGGKVIRRALKSILDQTFTDFELVIVDDGSTDNTLEILKLYIDERVKVTTIEHQGIAFALNHGLTVCRGKFIARMDADDFSFPQRLSLQVQFLNDYPDVGAVASQVQYSSDEENQKGYADFVTWTNLIITPKQILSNRFVESPLVHPSVMFRKSLVEKFGGYSTNNLPEDYELWLRWMNENVLISKIPEKLLEWKDSSQRLSRNHHNYIEEAFFQVKAHYFKLWYKKSGKNRKIYVWGRGNVMRRRLKYFLEKELKISGYIDIIKKESNSIADGEHLYFKDHQSYENGIVMGFVSDKKGKEKISEHLNTLSMKAGEDYFHMV